MGISRIQFTNPDSDQDIVPAQLSEENKSRVTEKIRDLPEDQKALLSAFLLFHEKNGIQNTPVLHKDTDLTFLVPDHANPPALIEKTIQISHDLVPVPVTIGGKKTYRYKILTNNDPKAEGYYGEVKDVIGEVKHKKGNIYVKPLKETKKSIDKIQKHWDSHPIDEGKEEAEIQQQMRSTAFPAVIEAKINLTDGVSHTIDADLKRTLAEYDADLPKNIRSYLPLVIKILRALSDFHIKTQHVHCDLKPANIMVDEQENVHLIDYGLSIPKDQASLPPNQRKSGLGSLEYTSPESLIRNYDPKTGERRTELLSVPKVEITQSADIYAAGLVILELLFRKRRELPLVKTESQKAYRVDTKSPEWKDFLEKINKYTKESDLEVIHEELITFDGTEQANGLEKIILEKMLRMHAHNRASLDSIIDDFETFRLELDNRHLKARKNAYQVANEARKKLLALESRTPKKEACGEIQDILLAALEDSKLKDTPHAIAEFTHTLGITSLQQLKSKSELKQKIRSEIEDYTKHHDKLTKLKQFAVDHHLADVVEDIDHLYYRDEKRLCKFDHIAKCNSIFADRLKRLGLLEKNDKYTVTVDPFLCEKYPYYHQLLELVLKKYVKKATHLTRDKEYKVKTPDGKTVKVTLTHDLLVDPINLGWKRLPRYHILGNTKEDILGSGDYGRVIRVVGSIKFEPDGQTERMLVKPTKPGKNKVIKIQHQNELNPYRHFADAEREARLSKLANRSVKDVIREDTSLFTANSYIIDREGTPLHKFLEKIKKGEIKAPDKTWFLKFSVSLLQALKKFHALGEVGYVHHDIKLNNLLVDPVTAEVRLIDFGAAKKADSIFPWGGDPEFRAPEKNNGWNYILRVALCWVKLAPSFFGRLYKFWMNIISPASDFYAAGKVLQKVSDALKIVDHTISDSICTLVDRNPRKRDLDKTCTVLETAFPPTRNSSESDTLTTSSDGSADGSQSGSEEKSDEVLAPNPLDADMQADEELIIKLRNDLARYEASPTKSSTLADALKDAIGKANDLPCFIKRMGIKVLQDASDQSVAGLQTEIDSICDSFRNNAIQVRRIRDQLSFALLMLQTKPENEKNTALISELESLLLEVDKLNLKINNQHFNLDGLKKLNQKLAEPLAELDRKLKAIQYEKELLQLASPSEEQTESEQFTNIISAALVEYLRLNLARSDTSAPTRPKEVLAVLKAAKDRTGFTEDTSEKDKVKEIRKRVKREVSKCKSTFFGSALKSGVTEKLDQAKKLIKTM